MASRGDEWEREVLFVRHLSGQHDQRKHGRKGASNPSVLRQVEARREAYERLRLDGEERRPLKAEAASRVAEGWDVPPEEALAAALDVTGGGGADMFGLGELYNALGASDAGEYGIRRNLDENGGELVYGGGPYLVQHFPPGWHQQYSEYDRLDTPEGRALAKEAAASALIGQWAHTSNDNSPGALAMQESIRREFGLDDAADWELQSPSPYSTWRTADERDAIVAAHGPALQSFSRSMYNATQQDLAAQGITEVGVMRGYGGRRDPEGMPPVARVSTTLRPASAWSMDPTIAEDFGPVQLVTTVPASQVLSTPRTGFGCLAESEVVLLGQPIEATRVHVDYSTRAGATWVADSVREPTPGTVLLDRLATDGSEVWRDDMTISDWTAATLGHSMADPWALARPAVVS